MLKKKKLVKKQVSTGSDAFWGDTKSLIERGAITPFISNFMTTAIFQSDPTELAREWADDCDVEDPTLAPISPLAEEHNLRLPRVAQYYSVRSSTRAAKSYYLDTLKGFLLGMADDDDDVDPDALEEVEEKLQHKEKLGLAKMADDLAYPKDIQTNENPLRLLAEMPLPIYLTTSHHRFLELAMQRTQPPKKPVSEIFYWDDTLHHIPSIYDKEPDYQPSVDRPLVYHLYGLDQYPESLVLTEDDYLDFLIAVSSPDVRHSEQQHGIPSSVMKALAGTPLLLLGYEVYEWEFRILFRGIIRALNDSRGNNRNVAEGISMQIEPGENHKDPTQVKEYLAKYFELSRFKVYWGDVNSCVQELYQAWKG